jgi:CRISPR-associated protein Csm4
MVDICYKLRFEAPLHVDGRGTAYYERAEHFIRSDTLSAAISSNWLQLFPADASIIANPPWLVSSLFPYFRDLLFLPRPIASRAISSDPEHAKKIKKLQWLELSIWKSVAEGAPDWHRGIESGEGGVASRQSLPVLWLEEGKPRIAVDRGNNGAAEGRIFHFSRVHYRQDAGLYFFARFENDAVREKFEAALRLLGDCGIGSDRNCGHGRFCFRSEKTTMPNPARPVCLSLCSPDPETDMEDGWLDDAAYDLVRRGGWIGGSSWRKASLRMFVEGSQFPRCLNGRMVDVGRHPVHGHPVWRDGRAFMVGGMP